MANEATLGEIIHRGLRLADMDRNDLQSDGYISFEEARDYANDALEDLHLILANTGAMYSRKTHSISLVSGQRVYPLPTDFLHCYHIFPVVGSDGRLKRPLERFYPDELHIYDWEAVVTSEPYFLRYAIVGQSLEFDPLPGSGTLEMWYCPQYQILENENDIVDISVPARWERYAIYGIAAQCILKEKGDATFFLAKQEQAKDMIVRSATPRDQGNNRRVIDSSGRTRYKRRRWL